MEENLTRKERRAMERHKEQSRPRDKGPLILGGILTVIVAGMVGLFVAGGGGSSDQANTPQGEVVSQTGVHWHPELEMYVKGERVTIPPNIGLGGGEMKVHTHDDMPKIHYEYAAGPVTKDMAKLGAFFTTWGKTFNSGQLIDTKGTVKMTVNGQDNSEYENYVVKDGDKIVIRAE